MYFFQVTNDQSMIYNTSYLCLILCQGFIRSHLFPLKCSISFLERKYLFFFVLCQGVIVWNWCADLLHKSCKNRTWLMFKPVTDYHLQWIGWQRRAFDWFIMVSRILAKSILLQYFDLMHMLTSNTLLIHVWTRESIKTTTRIQKNGVKYTVFSQRHNLDHHSISTSPSTEKG